MTKCLVIKQDFELKSYKYRILKDIEITIRRGLWRRDKNIDDPV
jgi:hypothetical protein